MFQLPDRRPGPRPDHRGAAQPLCPAPPPVYAGSQPAARWPPAASGSADHCDHEPGPQRRLDARRGQRGDLVGRRDARSRSRRRPSSRAGTERGEPRRPARRPAERPSAVEVVRGRRADRAGDVPGPRVDRLHLAAVPLARPGVEQHAAGRRQGGGLVGVEHRHAAAGQRHVARLGDDVPGLQRAAGRGQASSPPSSSRTSVRPPQRSSHQARAAASPPVAS